MPAPSLPAGLYALVDDGLAAGRPLESLVDAAVEGGAAVLQLRLKQTGDRPAIELLRTTMPRARQTGCKVLVNDRVDWALAGGADGVHLGADDLPVAVARRLLGSTALVGATVRNLGDIRRARDEGADHVGLGPVFGTSTKRVAAPILGVEALGEMCRPSPLPVVAIGGITLSTIGQVARAGARCAAVGQGWLEAEASGLVARVQALQRAFKAG